MPVLERDEATLHAAVGQHLVDCVTRDGAYRCASEIAKASEDIAAIEVCSGRRVHDGRTHVPVGELMLEARERSTEADVQPSSKARARARALLSRQLPLATPQTGRRTPLEPQTTFVLEPSEGDG